MGQLVADYPFRLPFPFWMDTKIDNHVLSEQFWLLVAPIVYLRTRSVVKAVLSLPMVFSIHEGLWFWNEAWFNKSGLLGTSLWPYYSLPLVWTGTLGYIWLDWKFPAKVFLTMVPFYLFWALIGFPTILGFGQSFVEATTPLWVHAIEIESWSLVPLSAFLFAKSSRGRPSG